MSNEDVILNFNPEHPQKRFKDKRIKGATAEPSQLLPGDVPWPKQLKPTPAPLRPAPAETDSLERFQGYDALVVTWTAAEAASLAALLTPGYQTSDWYEYRYNVNEYIPLVTGGDAPFNSTDREDARYYHSLGLYFPCTIGNYRVLLFKSGLHLDYDGPAVPVRKLMAELATTIHPKVFITTGTGGGIGAQVALADIIIAGQARFDCTTIFASEPWHNAVFKTSPIPQAMLDAITPSLLKVNAARVPNARKTPKVWSGSQATVVTTDFFGFDDSTDYYKLQGLGQVCDMGDAMVGMALEQFPDISWYSIRNASDPQIPNPNNNIQQAGKEATEIYSRYGALTTAGSVIATWAVITNIPSIKTTNKVAPSEHQKHPIKSMKQNIFRLGKTPAVFDSRTLRFSAYLAPHLPPPPASINYGKNVPQWPMYLNNQYGDCTCAAVGHMIECWTATAGAEKSPSDADILKFYEHFTTPGPENGCNMLDVLKYWRSTGLAGDKILAFAQLEGKNIIEAQDSVSLLGSLYIGLELPDFAVNSSDMLGVPWVVPPQGPVGDAAPNPQNGHCVPAVAYDQRNLYIVTWGAIKSMSWQFYQTYADEAYAVLSADFLKNGHNPQGLDLAQLKCDLSEIEKVPAARAAVRRRRAAAEV